MKLPVVHSSFWFCSAFCFLHILFLSACKWLSEQCLTSPPTQYTGDGFYRSKDPTNSIKVLKMLVPVHIHNRWAILKNLLARGLLAVKALTPTRWSMWDAVKVLIAGYKNIWQALCTIADEDWSEKIDQLGTSNNSVRTYRAAPRRVVHWTLTMLFCCWNLWKSVWSAGTEGHGAEIKGCKAVLARLKKIQCSTDAVWGQRQEDITESPGIKNAGVSANYRVCCKPLVIAYVCRLNLSQKGLGFSITFWAFQPCLVQDELIQLISYAKNHVTQHLTKPDSFKLVLFHMVAKSGVHDCFPMLMICYAFIWLSWSQTVVM